MTASAHAWLGALVLAANLGVGLWALWVVRRGGPATPALTIAYGLAVGLLAVHFLLSMALWLDGGLPPVSRRLVWAHGGGPLAALLLALGLVSGEGTRTPTRFAAGTLAIAAVAVLDFSLLSLG